MTIKIDNETILDLMDKAYLVGFDIHRLCKMIRKGCSEKECNEVLTENLKQTFMPDWNDDNTNQMILLIQEYHLMILQGLVILL